MNVVNMNTNCTFQEIKESNIFMDAFFILCTVVDSFAAAKRYTMS